MAGGQLWNRQWRLVCIPLQIFGWKKCYIPNDIIGKLKEDKTVWENYQQFSNAYRRIRIAYIEAARKRPEEFEKRLNNFINKTKENKMIKGFGGIEKYY